MEIGCLYGDKMLGHNLFNYFAKASLQELKKLDSCEEIQKLKSEIDIKNENLKIFSEKISYFETENKNLINSNIAVKETE